jgi:hypothetical protein
MSIDIRPAAAEVRVLAMAETAEAKFRRLDAQVVAHRDAMFRCIAAIQEIRDTGCWMTAFPTFEAYCQDRLRMSSQRVRQLEGGLRLKAVLTETDDCEDGQDGDCGSSDVTAVTSDDPNPQTVNLGKLAAQLAPQASEWQVRPLEKLDTDEAKREAWQEAIRRSGMQLPTGRTMEEVVDEIVEQHASRAVPLDRALAEEAGVTRREARDALDITTLAADDRQALEDAGCTPAQVAKVARIRDATQRTELASVLCGLLPGADDPAAEFERVWAEEFGPIPPGAVVTEVNGGPTGREPSEDDLDDEEWLGRCKVRSLVANPRLFDQEALRWRHYRKAIKRFRDELRSQGFGEKKVGAQGWFTAALSRVVNARHPWQWLRCGKCDGRGVVAVHNQGITCGQCQGTGFRD